MMPDIDATPTVIAHTTNTAAKANTMMELADDEAKDHIPLAQRFANVPFATKIDVELNQGTKIQSKQTPNSMIKKIKMKARKPTMKVSIGNQPSTSTTN